MPAMLAMYVIPVAMIPVVPFVALVFHIIWGSHVALAFMAIAATIGIACWVQYRAGKREWIETHLGKRWILTHGTLGASVFFFFLALVCFLLDYLLFVAGFSTFWGCLFLFASFCAARGYKKFRKSPEAYKKWNEASHQAQETNPFKDTPQASASAYTAGGKGSANYRGL